MALTAAVTWLPLSVISTVSMSGTHARAHVCTHLPDFIQQLVNWLVSALYGLCKAERFAESEMSAWKNVLVPFALLFLLLGVVSSEFGCIWLGWQHEIVTLVHHSEKTAVL